MDQATGSGLALEYELMKQQKYRGYMSNVDKALKNFEGSCSEWADLIAALGKLNKVISSYPQYDIIPRRIKISKRLAQCMHPNLPSGVHLKALETYSIIFQNAGVERLASELFIYSAGLFPLFGYAAMNVRPALLDIYESHFVPLGERLRPALSGFLSGVLPGLEVGMDHYKRTNMLLEQVCAAVSPSYFYTCVWECVATNSAIRLPAVTYVLDHFSRKMPLQEQDYILGENCDLTVSALCSCLNDPVILVQRNTLELLLIGFPMHNTVLAPADTIKLVTHGLNTILRRDMSLNRRLYSWLLGTEVAKQNLTNGTADSNASPHSNYFSKYSMQVLIKAFNATLKLSLLSTPVDLRPYKILISLLDKVEIGPVVLDDVLFNVIRTMYLSRANQEVNKQANLLFSTFDASYIWDFMTNLYSTTCIAASEERLNLTDMLGRENDEVQVDSGPPSLIEVCKLTEFLLETVSLEMYNETTRLYLPRVLLAITKMLTIYAENLIDDEVSASLKLMQKIVTRVQPMITSPLRPVVEKDTSNKEEKPVLEKSKSDSKLNQIEEETALKKSSSQSKIPKSPKKTKKSKSYSKLTELDKDPLDIICTDTGQLVNSTPNLEEKLADIPEKENGVGKEDQQTELSLPEYSILEKCIKQYEIFVQVYLSSKVFRVENRSGVTVRVLSAQESIEKSKFLNEELVVDENPNRIEAIDTIFSTLETESECRVAKLKDLLNACISEGQFHKRPNDTSLPSQQLPTQTSRKLKQTDIIIGQLLSQRQSEPFRDALKLACNLLVDMSTFPSYNQEHVYDETDVTLPPWLKSLAIIACYLCCDRDTQISVISILFELISLLKPAGRHSSAPGVTAVVMLPLMERGHLNYMGRRTRIFHILISTLWDYLGDPAVDNSIITKLLYQLHNCLNTGIVESVIGNRLANTHLIWSSSLLESIRKNPKGNESLLAYNDTRLTDLVICKPIIPIQTDQMTEKQGIGFKKFELLWHLAPNQEIENGFEKLQMRMYDSLSLPLPIRSMVIKWLQDSLLRGDIGILLKPLLKVLLALQSRRVSLIQIASRNEEQMPSKLEKSLTQYDLLDEKDLYAVSTEPSSSGTRYRTEAISKKKSPKGLRIFGVPLNPIKSKTPSLENVKKFITNSSKTPEDQNISLIVNPLENSSDVDTPEVDEFGIPLSSSAPTKHDYLESQSTGELSRKKVDLSDTASLSSESEISELISFSSLQETTKRYSGNCEHVEEKISAFDKIRNRKTYKLVKQEEAVLYRSDAEDKSLTEMSIRIRQTEIEEGTQLNDSLEEVVKEADSDSQKRLSVSSKQSETSSSSSSGNRGSSLEPPHSSADVLVEEESLSLDEELANMDPKGKVEIKSKTPEARRRGQITTDMNWEKTKEKFEKSKLNLEILRQNLIEENLKLDKIDPYHTHIFLYLASYDTKQTLYALQTLRNIIAVDTRMFVIISLTTSVSSQVRQLLEKHRRSIDGRESMDSSDSASSKKSTSDSQYSYRGCMYFEALISICLHYCRSYFQRDILSNNKSSKDTPSPEEITDNFKIQIESIDLLTTLLTELIAVVKEMGKGLKLSSYVADLMNKCRIPKVVLLSIMTSVNAITNRGASKTIQFVINDPSDESLFAESIQLQLLKLLNAIIKLEYEVRSQLNDESFKEIVQGSPTRLLVNVPTNAKYLPGYTIPQQPMFMAAIITALQSDALKHLHKNWTSIITSCMHCYTGGSLTNIVINVVHQVCNNIDKLIQHPVTIPVDYAASQMEALTTLCHYCLLDTTQQGSLLNANASFSQGIQQISGQILNNLVSALMASTTTFFASKSNSHHIAARNAVLSHLPRIIGSTAGLWEHELGQTRFVKQQLFDFLNPICLHHTSNFLAALAVAWHERHNRSTDARRSSDGSPTVATKYLPQASTDQLTLIKLITGIRAMRMDLFIRTLHDIIKTPPTIYNPPMGWNLEVSGLELFYFYLTDASATHLLDAWPSLLGLLRDGINSTPPALFVMSAILSIYVQRCPHMPFNDRKDLRDLHDITSKLVDALSLIAGANLEQTTWLRRNLAVKEDVAGESIKDSPGVTNAQYSVQAQSIMACLLANLLDVAYGSVEKDKVANIVTTVMYNIVPYLKNHMARNIPSFYACSNLLANLSGYQNTRKAWRKDAFDLLVDPAFFQMDATCLPFWKTILDNLMTYDNMSAFRDLMNRISLTQTGGLSIFSSKEQEYEQRAMLLKRLAFVIYCSEFDQYHKYMPEIQEQLANILRLPQMVHSVQAAVFLCFRVLLLRLSPDHVTSLWPTIIAEMVQVFLAIEQELRTDTEEFSQHIRMLSALDTQYVTNSSNGLHAQNHPHWKMVQLETAKLLELGCVLPAVNLPHFQMYRWAFVRSQYDWVTAPPSGIVNGSASDDQQILPVYVPYVTRIARLMDLRYTSHAPMHKQQRGHHLVLTCQTINSLQELYGFFSTLSVRWPTQNVVGDQEKEVKLILSEVEQVLANDFLEPLPHATLPR